MHVRVADEAYRQHQREPVGDRQPDRRSPDEPEHIELRVPVEVVPREEHGEKGQRDVDAHHLGLASKTEVLRHAAHQRTEAGAASGWRRARTGDRLVRDAVLAVEHAPILTTRRMCA